MSASRGLDRGGIAIRLQLAHKHRHIGQEALGHKVAQELLLNPVKQNKTKQKRGVVDEGLRAASDERGWGGVLILMYGRSRVTIDPRIPTMPRWSMSDFHRPG